MPAVASVFCHTGVPWVLIPQHILPGSLVLLLYKPDVIKAGGSRDEPKLLSLPALLSTAREAPELPVLLLCNGEGCSENGGEGFMHLV